MTYPDPPQDPYGQQPNPSNPYGQQPNPGDPYAQQPNPMDPYGQQPPSGPAGYPPTGYFAQPPAPTKSRTGLIVGIVVAVVLIGGAAIATPLALHHSSKTDSSDSGVAACQAVAGQDAGNGDGTLSKAEYDKVRGEFNDSSYADLRAAGTKTMDDIWKLIGAGADDADPAVAASVLTDYTGLARACASHGVTLQPFGGLGGGATPTGGDDSGTCADTEAQVSSLGTKLEGDVSDPAAYRKDLQDIIDELNSSAGEVSNTSWAKDMRAAAADFQEVLTDAKNGIQPSADLISRLTTDGDAVDADCS
jgi:hypothetical protein